MNNFISFRHFTGTIRERLTAASEYCRFHPGTVLKIPAGVYELEDPLAIETMEHVLHGDYGRNPEPTMFCPEFPFSVGLNLDGCRDITVDAYGAVLMVHGFMEPVGIRNSVNVTVNGLTVDHVRRPFSEGRVVRWEPDRVEVLFRESDPITAKAPAPRIMHYSSKENRFLYITLNPGSAEEIAPQRILYHGDFPENLEGESLYFCHTYHSRPALLISHSKNTCLNDVTIHNQPGMGIVGFKSRDIYIRRLHIVPSEGSHVSTNTDATHFSCCSGELLVENSMFAGHGDDAINVHNYYFTIHEADGNTCRISMDAPTGTHSSEPDYPETGYKLGLVDRKTLAMKEEYTVLESSNAENARLVLDKPLPKNTEDYLFANLTDLPALTFRGNHVRNHFARAVLIKTHNVLVENCLFEDSSGVAVHVAAEASWYEGIPSKNVVIRDNTFLRCGRYSDIAAVCVEISAEDQTVPGIHENLLIENNSIINGPASGGIAISVSGARDGIIRNNLYTGCETRVRIQHSENVVSED